MNHPLDRETIQKRQAEEAKVAKFVNQQLRADTQQVMNLPGMRRILYLFMQQMGLDNSPFATNAMAQSHAIGMQDAGKWWLNLIREHCPEKEVVIRVEGLEMFKPKPEAEEEDPA